MRKRSNSRSLSPKRKDKKRDRSPRDKDRNKDKDRRKKHERRRSLSPDDDDDKRSSGGKSVNKTASLAGLLENVPKKERGDKASTPSSSAPPDADVTTTDMDIDSD